MKRRAFVATAGVLPVVGCVGRSGADDESTPTSTTSTASETTGPETDRPSEQTMTGTSTSDIRPLRSVSVEQRDSLEQGLGARLDVELLKSTITSDHTAVMEVSIVNTGESNRTYQFGPIPVFSATASTDDRWLLVKPEQLERPSDGCWSHPKSKKEPGALATVRELAPGESAARTFELWSNSRLTEESCLPTGEYRFEDEYRVRQSDEKDDEFAWGFTLQVRE